MSLTERPFSMTIGPWCASSVLDSRLSTPLLAYTTNGRSAIIYSMNLNIRALMPTELNTEAAFIISMANPACATNVPEAEVEDTSSHEIHTSISNLQVYQRQTCGRRVLRVYNTKPRYLRASMA